MKVRLLTHDYIRSGTTAGSEHDVPNELGERLIEMGAAEKTKPTKNTTQPGEATLPEGTPGEDWTNSELKTYAEHHDIDLTAATKKAEYLDAIAHATAK